MIGVDLTIGICHSIFVMRIKSENLDIRQIAESGQCFRMNMTGEDSARIIAHSKLLDIKLAGKNAFDLSCSKTEYNRIWKEYLDLDTDYASFIEAIDPSDEYLNAAARGGSGIRILKQEPFETLISFIISQRKNIPAIKASVEKLCITCGKKITDDIYAFPDPEAISALSEKELSGCSLGYRAPYVREAARRIACGETDLEALRSLDDDRLMEALLSFYGVGKKVANCVMLFAYHRISAFPVDVWISRIEDAHYGGRFPVERYPGFAGILQQYMFFYSRNK